MLLLLCGCINTRPEQEHIWTFERVYAGEHRKCGGGWELETVAKDGTVIIRLDSGEFVSGRPGEVLNFRGEGAREVRLLSSSYSKQSAKFRIVVH